jgi:arginase
VRVEDVVLVGARDLDPPEEAFIEASGLAQGVEHLDVALTDADAVYVAFDADVIDRVELASFMPVPGGMTLVEVGDVLRHVAGRTAVAGVGLTGLTADAASIEPLAGLISSLGL